MQKHLTCNFDRASLNKSRGSELHLKLKGHEASYWPKV